MTLTSPTTAIVVPETVNRLVLLAIETIPIPAGNGGREVILILELAPRSGKDVILTTELAPKSGKEVIAIVVPDTVNGTVDKLLTVTEVIDTEEAGIDIITTCK